MVTVKEQEKLDRFLYYRSTKNNVILNHKF